MTRIRPSKMRLNDLRREKLLLRKPRNNWTLGYRSKVEPISTNQINLKKILMGKEMIKLKKNSF
jgi:hypothetical protein